MTRLKRRIAVAMSGGVDSSVTAALLKERGYAVVGFFVRTWTPEAGDGTTCTWVAERRDALRVAARLDIPLITIDLEATYRQNVVRPLVAGYAAGETPNPDVLCNRVIKFDALWQAAAAYGVEQLATGHYARLVTTATGPAIARGLDADKDQSYFLWDIPPDMLRHIQFPIGGLTKPEVRQHAARFGLPVADKKDSQGICFLGPTDIQQFLDRQLPTAQGPIRDILTGRQIGYHSGIHHATIGQRHHIGSMLSSEAPLFVVRLDILAQTIWVGPRTALYHRTVTIREANWLSNDWHEALASHQPLSVSAQVRYRQAPLAAELIEKKNAVVVRFRRPVYAPAPGQSIVFYDQDRLLGGATIDTVPEVSRIASTKTVE